MKEQSKLTGYFYEQCQMSISAPVRSLINIAMDGDSRLGFALLVSLPEIYPRVIAKLYFEAQAGRKRWATDRVPHWYASHETVDFASRVTGSHLPLWNS